MVSAPRRYRQQSTRRDAFISRHTSFSSRAWAHARERFPKSVCPPGCHGFMGRNASSEEDAGPATNAGGLNDSPFYTSNCMTESRRPPRRGRGRRPTNRPAGDAGDNPYRDDAEAGAATLPPDTPEPLTGDDGPSSRATRDTLPRDDDYGSRDVDEPSAPPMPSESHGGDANDESRGGRGSDVNDSSVTPSDGDNGGAGAGAPHPNDSSSRAVASRMPAAESAAAVAAAAGVGAATISHPKTRSIATATEATIGATTAAAARISRTGGTDVDIAEDADAVRGVNKHQRRRSSRRPLRRRARSAGGSTSRATLASFAVRPTAISPTPAIRTSRRISSANSRCAAPI